MKVVSSVKWSETSRAEGQTGMTKDAYTIGVGAKVHYCIYRGKLYMRLTELEE